MTQLAQSQNKHPDSVVKGHKCPMPGCYSDTCGSRGERARGIALLSPSTCSTLRPGRGRTSRTHHSSPKFCASVHKRVKANLLADLHASWSRPATSRIQDSVPQTQRRLLAGRSTLSTRYVRGTAALGCIIPSDEGISDHTTAYASAPSSSWPSLPTAAITADATGPKVQYAWSDSSYAAASCTTSVRHASLL